MKAAQINTYGGPDVIEINPDAQKPSLKEGQMLVEVHAAGLNRIDSAVRNGYLQQMLPLTFPVVMGGDFAGIVTEVGDGVSEFKVGDEVYGNAGQFKGGPGAIAEFTATNTTNTGHKPKSLDFKQAAALPLVGASALQAIDDEIDIQAGQRIFIQGGAGGVGALAIQLAKLRGAYIATSVGTDDITLAKELGADEVIDYKSQDVTQVLKDFDAVFDTAGGDGVNKLFAVLKKGGVLVTIAGQPDQELATQHEVKAVNQVTNVSTEQLQKIAELVNTGKLKVQIEKTFAFDEVKDAFTYFETKHPKGKIVIEIK